MFRNRTYRNLVKGDGLVCFHVTVMETDLAVHADRNLEADARDLVVKYRAIIESYIRQYPEFASTLDPWPQKARRGMWAPIP